MAGRTPHRSRTGGQPDAIAGARVSGAPVRFKARIARTGAQQYESGPEYRDAAEVFDAASLATLDGVRVTVGHFDMTPVGRVVPGSHSRELGPDGESYLTAVLEITDSSTAARIRTKELQGLSCGYSCERVVRGVLSHQTQIRFDHVALLQRDRERPRCGQHCSIHDREDNMRVQRTDSGGTIDAVACNCDAAEKDRIQGWLDAYSANIGVTCDALVDELIRAHGSQAHVSKDMIVQAAERLAPRGVYVTPNSPAQYGVRKDAAQSPRLDLDNDDQFRAFLAGQDAPAHNDSAEPTGDGNRLDLSDDDQFRAHLAAQGGAQ